MDFQLAIALVSTVSLFLPVWILSGDNTLDRFVESY